MTTHVIEALDNMTSQPVLIIAGWSRVTSQFYMHVMTDDHSQDRRIIFTSDEVSYRSHNPGLEFDCYIDALNVMNIDIWADACNEIKLESENSNMLPVKLWPSRRLLIADSINGIDFEDENELDVDDILCFDEFRQQVSSLHPMASIGCYVTKQQYDSLFVS